SGTGVDGEEPSLVGGREQPPAVGRPSELARADGPADGCIDSHLVAADEVDEVQASLRAVVAAAYERGGRPRRRDRPGGDPSSVAAVGDPSQHPRGTAVS